MSSTSRFPHDDRPVATRLHFYQSKMDDQCPSRRKWPDKKLPTEEANDRARARVQRLGSVQCSRRDQFYQKQNNGLRRRRRAFVDSSTRSSTEKWFERERGESGIGGRENKIKGPSLFHLINAILRRENAHFLPVWRAFYFASAFFSFSFINISSNGTNLHFQHSRVDHKHMQPGKGSLFVGRFC